MASNQSSSTTENVSSPLSTGQAGPFFEQHVNAYWLSLLLVGAIPPLLLDCVVEEVHFQTEYLGFNTDDFLVSGQNGTGIGRKLLGQVKRSLTVSSSDEEFKKAIGDFWKDYKNTQLFNKDTDKFVFVTLRGTNVLLEHFVGLLDCARASFDSSDFERRLTTSGFISNKSVSHRQVVRSIINELEPKEVSLDEVWLFLKLLHVISLDLNTSTAQTEAQIKSLLSYASQDHDPRGASDSTWRILLEEIGRSMPAARKYTRENLPEIARKNHGIVSSPTKQILIDLEHHSTPILSNIRTTFDNGFCLTRTSLKQFLVSQIGSSQVVIISGPAGSGKSAIAKKALEILSQDYFVFSFRAEEFACPHLDETLLKAQVSANTNKLAAILAGQDRKVLLVESVERLLEASTRDAFSDLLSLIEKDRSWSIVLTCRSYSTDLVRASFFASVGLTPSIVELPLLTDEELSEAQIHFPQIESLLSSEKLRALLRNPYILDTAVRMPWTSDQTLPQSEREFRLRFWQVRVRTENRTITEARRRESVFLEIAIRRARALSPYVECHDLDGMTVESLLSDGLVNFKPHTDLLIAPAHDVLEDWCILKWIEQQYTLHQSRIERLPELIGSYPAVRRTYRKWVGELIESNSHDADKLLTAAINNEFSTSWFRDDTLIALLRSEHAVPFLSRHKSALFQNDKLLLKRILHLLRVGCVKTPPWLKDLPISSSLWAIPDGPVWSMVLRLVSENLDSFRENDGLLLLGFIEDWARGVSQEDPYPDGASFASAIAYWLLPHFLSYREEGYLEDALEIIAKIPKVNPDGLTILLLKNQRGLDYDKTSQKLQELVLTDYKGWAVCRDMPEVIFKAANHTFLLSEQEIQDDFGLSAAHGIEALFGLQYWTGMNYFPSSAFHGPFVPLLNHHSQAAISFVLELLNHCVDWYAHPRIPNHYVEPPYEINLIFPNGKVKKQWCNSRLWNMYRATSVGPQVLACALMALENWLLEYAQKHSNQLDEILIHILKNSDSVATTAVAASVATAFPHLAGETLLTLLSFPECFELDRHRVVAESQVPSRIPIPMYAGKNDLYGDERKKADAKPHRQQHLEHAILNLQLGSY